MRCPEDQDWGDQGYRFPQCGSAQCKSKLSGRGASNRPRDQEKDFDITFDRIHEKRAE
jgi:hypothetical protein